MEIVHTQGTKVTIPEHVFTNIGDLPFLGEGSFGEVYRYDDVTTGFQFAMKKICLPRGGKFTEAAEKVRGEIDIHSKMHHKNIVQYFGCQNFNNTFFICLEYVAIN